MTHIEMIAYYEANLSAVVSSHGVASDYTTYAFYQFQGAKMGKSVLELCEFARDEMERLHQLTLDLI
jgi:hypothetical protein